MEKSKSRTYMCFSVAQKDFLRSRGQEYVCVGLHQESLKTFWAFLRCDELDKLLDEWSNKRKSFSSIR